MFWRWTWVAAAKYPIDIGVPPPSLREDERDIGHGGARLRESADSHLPDALASMLQHIWTSMLHQQGPESKIWLGFLLFSASLATHTLPISEYYCILLPRGHAGSDSVRRRVVVVQVRLRPPSAAGRGTRWPVGV